MNKKFIAMMCASVLLVIFGSGCLKENEEGKNHIAVIETNMGIIKFELFEKRAPITTENFIKLANDDFYNGLVFHRVIDDFVIQGGGFYPNGSMKESQYGPINLEIHPELRHDDGAVAMARTNNPNSATSQFYICDGPQHNLDDDYMKQYGQRGYAVFGKVIDGMEVVRVIAEVKTGSRYGHQDWPLEDVVINKIYIENGY